MVALCEFATRDLGVGRRLEPLLQSALGSHWLHCRFTGSDVGTSRFFPDGWEGRALAVVARRGEHGCDLGGSARDGEDLMVQTVSSTQTMRGAKWTRILATIGLVLAGIMSVFNLINGITSLINPMVGLEDGVAPQPEWISILLIGFGAVTLVALVPAWRGHRASIWVVVISRLLEAWSAIVLPFVPGAPDGLWPFVIALIIVGTAVAGLVALRLRR